MDLWTYHFGTPKDFLILYNIAGILPRDKDKEKDKDKEGQKDKEKEKDREKEKNVTFDKKNDKTTSKMKNIVDINDNKNESERENEKIIKICNLITLKNSIKNVIKNVFEFISTNFSTENSEIEEINKNKDKSKDEKFNQDDDEMDINIEINGNKSYQTENGYENRNQRNEEMNTQKKNKINKILKCSAEDMKNIFENQGLTLYNLTKEYSKEHSSSQREITMKNCFYCFEKGTKLIELFHILILITIQFAFVLIFIFIFLFYLIYRGSSFFIFHAYLFSVFFSPTSIE